MEQIAAYKIERTRGFIHITALLARVVKMFHIERLHLYPFHGQQHRQRARECVQRKFT